MKAFKYFSIPNLLKFILKNHQRKKAGFPTFHNHNNYLVLFFISSLTLFANLSKEIVTFSSLLLVL